MTRKFVKSQDFVAREVAGEFLLVPIRRRLSEVNSLYVLNETGAAVWRRLDGARSLHEIARELVDEYEVSSQALEQDLHELVRDLLSIQAIREVFH